MMSEKRFKLAYEKGNEAIFEDLALPPYPRRMTNKEVERKLNEQQAAINELQDTVYDELDKALKVLEEIYEDYPKNNVHRLYNNLKGLKEMIR